MKPPASEAVVIVGAGLAGSRVCSELRAAGWPGRIVLVGEEASLPYDRPPLSKAVITGRREPRPLKVDYEGLGVELRLGTAVEAADLSARILSTSAGRVPFDRLVVASGAAPVRLPGSGEQLTLRTDADATGLRDRMVDGARVVVIGASWIGAEVAHAAVKRGCAVTCLEFHAQPLTQALGGEVGALFTDWWDGVTLRTDVRVAAVEADGVHLADGEVVPADVVVTGIGVRAATGWLAGSGLELLPAVAVDERLRTPVPEVYALGDAAARWSPRFGKRLVVQHWDDAYTAPAVVASGIVHGAESDRVHDPVPYFWSDQFGHRIDYVGHHAPDDTVTVDRSREKGWTARWTGADGQLTAALGVDEGKLIAAWRGEIRSVVVV